MLTSLNIKNYALIEDIEIDLRNGLTTITGETGAGKSIILGAISLLAGNRADRSMIKNEDKKCIIEADFSIGHLNLQSLFEKLDIDYDDHTIIRREFSKEGKSRVFINDSPAILTNLKMVMNRLLDVHSQHENLSLNDRQFQLNTLDDLADNADLLKEYRFAYGEYEEAGQRLNELVAAADRLKENTDILNFQFNELDQANLHEDEQEGLESELDKLNNSEEIKGNFHAIENLFNDMESDPLSQLNRIHSLLDQLKSHFSEVEELASRLKASIIEIDDIRSEVEGHSEHFSYDPERLQIVQDRISLIYQLQQKYRVGNVSELIELKNKISEELLDIENYDERLEQAEKTFALKKKEAERLALQLSERRKAVVPYLQDGILKRLDMLGMSNSRFDVEFNQGELNQSGYDRIEFMFSANKGMEAKPIGKVASGGELSRLMLSIKAILTEKTALPTIIFDEIDTGISGPVADKMGRIIRDMSNGCQVVCITHLPQIAAAGHQHLVVYKNDEGEISRTMIRELEVEERTTEVARLLSGEELSQEALDNAKVLLSASN